MPEPLNIENLSIDLASSKARLERALAIESARIERSAVHGFQGQNMAQLEALARIYRSLASGAPTVDPLAQRPGESLEAWKARVDAL